MSMSHGHTTIGGIEWWLWRRQKGEDSLTSTRRITLQKIDTSVTFWAERFFFCHTYDTSVTIIVTKPGIIIDVVGSYFYDKKS